MPVGTLFQLKIVGWVVIARDRWGRIPGHRSGLVPRGYVAGTDRAVEGIARQHTVSGRWICRRAGELREIVETIYFSLGNSRCVVRASAREYPPRGLRHVRIRYSGWARDTVA
jgi:hypothetical protein